MLPAKPIIRECENCFELIKEFKLSSGNTFDAISWTDGFIDAPMLPEQKLYVKCPTCKTCLWIKDQKIIEIDNYDDVEDYLNPSLHEYDSALYDDFYSENKEMRLTTDRKKYLRIRIWWKHNNVRRNYWNLDRLSNIAVKNIQELYQLLNNDGCDETIIMAEIKRELEEFDEAMELLQYVENNFIAVTEFMASLILKKDYHVHKIQTINLDDFLNSLELLKNNE